MHVVFSALPLVAAILAVPQFLPQLGACNAPARRRACPGRGQR